MLKLQVDTINSIQFDKIVKLIKTLVPSEDNENMQFQPQ